MRSAGPIQNGMIGFYAHLNQLNNAAMLIKVGFTDNSGNWRLWFELDTDVDNWWRVKADDGAGGTSSTATAIASQALEETHLEMAIDPTNNSNVGIIMPTIEVAGVKEGLGWPGIVLPGGGATFIGSFKLACLCQSRSNLSKVYDIDFWEAWSDELIHAGASS